MMVKHICSSLSFTQASGPSELSDAVSSTRDQYLIYAEKYANALVKVEISCIDALKRIVSHAAGKVSRRVKGNRGAGAPVRATSSAVGYHYHYHCHYFVVASFH
jgi:hypothetical protein